MLKQKEKELAELAAESSRIALLLEKAKKELSEEKERLRRIEQKAEHLSELKKEFALCVQKLENASKQTARNIEETERLDKCIAALESKRIHINEELSNEIETKKRLMRNIERTLEETRSRLHELRAKKASSEELMRRILEMNSCPTCFQRVSEEHKTKIIEQEKKSVEEISLHYERFNREEKRIQAELQALNEEIEQLRKKEKEAIEARAALRELEVYLNRKNLLMTQQKELENEIVSASKRKEELMREIELFGNIINEHNEAKAMLDRAMEKERETELKKVMIDSKCNAVKEAIGMLSDEIEKKARAKNCLELLTKKRRWLEEQFIPLMASIERQVLLKAHSDFSSLFGKWFGMLMDNEAISVRLDEEFTPVIEQNGYETDYEFLSGGEKTAVALAYRLALNQVINNMMSNIKTRDLIILDEPTDGFSDEQLDRMRPVLDEIDIAQLILVSHEPKIESFVQNVIRFEKTGHVSKVYSVR